ncbi:MAG: DUF1501 domain-containing protein [Verrucomicrobiales bacterium]|nr:DUF1501 domain-containing protein [Verrucomicrobiales bacterium]
MHFSRRKFLKANALAWGALGINLFSPSLFQRRLLAAELPADKKLIFIFQNGGNDGINTVIPRGDPSYSTDTRPTLFIPEAQGLNLGNGFAQLHPALQPMMEIYNKTSLNGQEGPGNLAVLHRIGYSGQSRSHFDSQQYWQNGVPGQATLEEGMFYRHLNRTLNLGSAENAFVAAAISSSQMVALKGQKPFPNFNRATEFSFAGSAAKSKKFLGALPSTGGGPNGEGLMGLYGGPMDDPSKVYRPLVHETGQLLGSTMSILQGAVAQGTYTPANGAVYSNDTLGRKLMEAAMLFKRTPVKIVGMTIGGWDTHTGQGQLTGGHPNLLGQLARGFQALSRDLKDQWDKVIVVTMTEFGRTSEENGSQGTDHAEASTVFIAGGSVKGGVYNCDSSTWKANDMFSRSGRYLDRKTDFRAVFGELFTRHFGDAPGLLDDIIPGYSAAATKDPAGFKQLGFLNA